ncbi:MAG: rhomboid family intramembrane serine protease [Porphyromonadaceae bacterium]|nr:rhomboid family intramembrane serine protease [Porphyromonadaceae bacterium]
MARTTNRLLDSKTWGLLEWSIACNVGVSLLIWIGGAILPLVGLPAGWLGRVLKFVPDTYWLVRRPWSVLTYSLVHDGLLHLAINMAILWFIGRRFVEVFGVRRFVPLYLMAALSGSLLYLGGYSLLQALGVFVLPLGLVGSSAAIMALIFALAFYTPWLKLQTPLGRIGYAQMAGGILLLQLLLMLDNLGGQLAHVGGAGIGLIFGYYLRKQGRDITEPVSKLIDRLIVFLRRRTPSKAKRTKDKQDIPINEILDKLRQSGYSSLSAAEKRQLFSASKSEKGQKR